MKRWYEEIGIEHFGPEFIEVSNIIGLDNAIKLWEAFNKCQLYISEAQLRSAKREFILQHAETPARDLARSLQVSERYVYQVLQEARTEQMYPGLFDPPGD